MDYLDLFTNWRRWWPVLVGFIVMVLMIILLRSCTGCGKTEDVPARPFSSPSTPANTAVLIEYRTDTVVRYRDRLVVKQAPARIVSRRDTVVEWRDTSSGAETIGTPFTARLDTIIGRDTIEVEVDHPPPRLSVLLRPAPDSIRIDTRTITITERESAPWWQHALETLGGTLVGYGLGRIR